MLGMGPTGWCYDCGQLVMPSIGVSKNKHAKRFGQRQKHTSKSIKVSIIRGRFHTSPLFMPLSIPLNYHYRNLADNGRIMGR